MMSKAKWFAVRKPSTGEIIATSANQIVPLKFHGPTKILYYIHQTPLSSSSVEGGSGAETIQMHEQSIHYQWYTSSSIVSNTYYL